jgi:SAM-dependent methyltransferase
MWLAQRAGWVVEGVELNRRTAACAARRTGRPVHHADVRTLVLDGRRYGAVTLIDVLEHLPDPAPVLARLATLLAPGGWLVVKVPCGPSQWWKERVLAALVGGRDVSLADNLVHVSHFSPRSLASALGRAGFEAVRVETAPPELLPLGGAAVARRLSNGVRLAVYAAGRLPGAIRTPLALHLLAYGRRPLS